MVSPASLNGYPIFKDLPAPVMEKIAAICEEKDFKQGEIIFKEGQKADKLDFLIKGGIALRVNIMSKPQSLTVSFVTKSYECFGWSGLVSPHYYTATAYCEEDSQVMTLPGDQLLKILSEHSDAGFLVMHRIANLVSERLRNSRQALIKTL